jgi:hypothetical protein
MNLQEFDCIVVYRIYASDNSVFAITRRPSTKTWFVTCHFGEIVYYLNHYIANKGDEPIVCLTQTALGAEQPVCTNFKNRHKAFKELLIYCERCNITLFTSPQK